LTSTMALRAEKRGILPAGHLLNECGVPDKCVSCSISWKIEYSGRE
jgi:hypothetical protein